MRVAGFTERVLNTDKTPLQSALSLIRLRGNTPRSSRVSTYDSLFDSLQRMAIVVTLRESLRMLFILKYVFPDSVQDIKDEDIIYQTIEDRFGSSKKSNDINVNELADARKFQKNINTVFTILNHLCHEIAANGTMRSLTSSVDILKRMSNEEEQLMETYENGMTMLEHLRKNLTHERKCFGAELNHKSDEAFRIRENLILATEQAKMEMRYLCEWEDTRVEQNRIKLDNEEEKYMNTINQYQTEMEYEGRIHMELTTYLQESTDDSTQALENWIEKYDQDLEYMDAQIYNLKQRREEQELKFNELKQLYDKRQKEIEEWLVVKARMQEEERQLRLMEQAATRIQAWWRGVMVRKHLGPYRKKKKGKKGKDKKGKKKK